MQAQQLYCQDDGSVREGQVDPDSLVLNESEQPAVVDGVELYAGTITAALGEGSAQRVDCRVGDYPDGVRILLTAATIHQLEAEQVLRQVLGAFAATPVVPVYASDTSESREDLRVDWAAATDATALEPVGSGWTLTAPMWLADQEADPVRAELTVAWDGSADWLVWAGPEVLANFVPPQLDGPTDDELFQQAVAALLERPEDGVCRVDSPDVVRTDVRVDWDSARDRKPAGEWSWTVTAPLVVVEPDGSERQVDQLPVTMWWDSGQSAWRAGMAEEDLDKLDYE